MKRKVDLKIKIIIISLLIILSALVYISLPNLSYALNFKGNENINEVGKITWDHQDESEMITTKIRQHYGYTVQRQSGGVSYVEKEYVETAANCLGILNIDSYISSYLSPGLGNPDNPPSTYVWYNSLKQNSSIFCQQNGTPFPDLGDRILQMFHAKNTNTNQVQAKNVKREDRVEYFMNLADCPQTLEILWKDLKLNTIETIGEDVQENDLGFGIGESSKMYQHTLVRVSYVANPKDRKLDTIEAYIAAYSDRNIYRNDVAQIAMWAYKNGKSSNDLFIAATAVDKSLVGTTTVNGEEVRIPVFPEMQKTTDDTTGLSTGTLLDETKGTYKVGPIGMNAYSYSWCEEAANYSGELICGIVEMTVKLDNGDTITLDSIDDFEYVPGSQDSQYIKQSETIEIEYVTRVCKHSSSCTNCGKRFVGYETLVDSNGNVVDLKSPVYEDVCVHDPNCDGNCINSEEVTETQTVTYAISPEEEDYIYPTPNSKFYIHLPLEDCDGATKIEEIKAVYKWTTADGQGGDLIGKYDKILWESQGISRIDREYTGMAPECRNNYNCTKCDHTGLSYEAYSLGSEPEYSADCLSTYFNGSLYDGDPTKIKHAYFCGTTGYCEHGYSVTHYGCHMGFTREYCNCDGELNSGWDDEKEWIDEDCDCELEEDEECTKTHGYYEGGYTTHTHVNSCRCDSCDQDYCKDGFYLGRHYKDYQAFGTYVPSRDECNGEALCAEHEHNWCMRLVWLSKEITKDVASQKLIYIRKAKVDEHTLECYVRDIPLVAKVEIHKYIDDVKHASKEAKYNGIDTTYTGTDSLNRSKLAEGTKQSNPVYVETNDWVIYKIEVKNFSAFGVKVRVDDILPAQTNAGDVYDYATIIIGDKAYTEDLKQIRNQEIEIDAANTAEILVELQVKADNKFLEGSNGDVYENKAKIITRNGHEKDDITADEVDDVDYVKTADDDGPVVLHANVNADGSTDLPQVESSDWFKLNTYNAFVDKYVYSYDEKVQKENNDVLGISKEDSVIGEDGQLLQEVDGKDVSRRNISKTITKVNDGNVQDEIRNDNRAKEKYKEEHPVNVEQTEKITYAIRVSNEAKTIEKTEKTGNKRATQIKDIRVEDILHDGLKYVGISAKIFEIGADGKDTEIGEPEGISCGGIGNKYYIEAPGTILNPNQYIEFYMEVEVIQSNMYLFSMDNSAELISASNINSDLEYTDNKGNKKSDEIKIWDKDDASIDRMISEQTISKEFVRMKDLLIAGYVWLDLDQDGLMNDKARSELDKVNNNINDNAMKEDVVVKLYRVDGDTATEYRKTKTDENGLYTFARGEESSSWYDTFNHTVDYKADGFETSKTVNDVEYQRIDKADGKDQYGNYTANSKNYSYYVEFEYDGVLYRSTEIYADNKNLNSDGSFDANGQYPIDSNAMELTSDREEFNKRYEYISYNVAYDMDMVKSGDLVFQKDGHSSYLMEDPARDMTAKSFITKETELIKYLWLYQMSGDNTLPKTDYLKYINLGLELREDVDLALTKDVYNLKTTVNGEEMEYDYNLGDTANFLNDYIVKKPYGFEIYESDYKYRVEQYIANAVEAYKGINGEDELNVEITYRINLQNLTTKDDEEMSALEPDNPEVNKNTPLHVRVHEILDLYDENFMEYTEEAIKVKVKNAEGFLEDKEIEVAEAWMFMTKEEAAGKELLEEGTTYKPRKASDGTNTSNNDIFVEDANGDYVKVKLQISNSSVYSAKANDFKDDGYHTAYITGMGDQVILEGEDMNIYVKYVVDKDKLEITVDEDYDSTTTVTREALNTTTQKVENVTMANNNISAVITDILTETITDGGATKTVTTAKLDRSLRLKDNRVATNPFKQQNGRGTENIAQVDAYSVWYDEAGTVPASLVDKDSNAGNIGIKNTSTNASPNGSGYSEEATSADDIEFYEDTTYKTGIELAAEGTEQTRDEVEEEYDDRIPDVDRVIETTTEYDLIRKITGKVWDDSRSTKLGEGNEIQYVANGMYSTDDTKLEEAKDNKNVELNYKEPEVTEQKDIAVRNAKAEFVEIVNIPRKDSEGNYILDESGKKQFDYYEEVLTNVTWDQVQNVRTAEDGSYTLEGFKPGRYIVRFTYGDVEEIAKDGTNKWDKIAEFDDRIKALSERTDLKESQKYAEREAILNERDQLLESDPELLAVKDMLIFNGQDYKSTKYTGVNDDPTLKDDEVLDAFQKPNNSDARDDEVRRLTVNAYSEVMTNEMAEILKGLVNGNKTYTPNSTANTSSELKALTDNTYMKADTVEFLIKPEKLIETETINQKPAYALEYMFNDALPYYKYLTALKNEHIKERDFTIQNVDFGIEYRPESQISLMKEIKEITLKTTAKNGESDILVNLHFETEGDGVNRTHKIIEEDSIGYDLVQFITNNYTDKTLINNVMSEESLQGLVYIQVDEEILQGCTIEITYGFDAQNNSEIDRISKQLNAIRYRDNKATDVLIDAYNTKYASQDHKTIGLLDFTNVMNTKYTASGLAKAAAFTDAFALDEQGLVYREIPKVTTTNGTDGYYGKFVGYGYYIGELSDLDTISSLKFDKILDYIDTNLEYEQKTNSEEMTNKLWSRITSKELVGLVSQYKAYRNADDETIAGIKVTNIDGIEYKSMVVSVDDRNVDPGDPNDKGEVKNKDLSKFLLPKVSLVGMFGEDDVHSEDYEKYTGHIYLDVSKVLAAGSDADDKTYENMAEIVQFTTLNGRRTNFATTIGNADIKVIKEKLDNNLPPFESIDPDNPKNPGSIEFITASIEPDTSATETITLIPPTGLMRSRRPIVNIMEATKTGIEVMSMVGLVVAIVLAIGAVVVYTTRRVQRKRIK